MGELRSFSVINIYVYGLYKGPFLKNEWPNVSVI